jgi:hypothetical protein
MALRPPVTWFHGGVPGLEPGDLVLPPSKTGVLIMGEIPRHYDGSGWAASGYADVRGKDHPALVHIVDDLDNAMLFAAFWTICPWHEWLLPY